MSVKVASMANGAVNGSASVVIADGILDFSGGVNSLKPTTVASAQAPNGLARNQVAWMNNCTCRGNGITCRYGWTYLTTVHDGSRIYQGGYMYEPREGLPYLVLSIGGVIYRVRVDTDNSVQNITPVGAQNPDNEPQAFLAQGEEFLVIQAGDNQTLPLFWDGVTLRRSQGPAQIVGITSANFTIPAIGSVVLVTLTSDFAFADGTVVLLNGVTTRRYQIGAGNLVQQFITLKCINDGAGLTNSPGSNVLSLPPYVAHTAAPVTKASGFSLNVVMDTPFTFGSGHPGIYLNGIPEFILSQSDSTHIVVYGQLSGAAYSQMLNSPVGTGITLNSPGTSIGTLVTGFTAPANGGTITTLISTPYTGPLGRPVKINGAVYEVVSVGLPMIPANQVYITNLTDTTVGTVTAGASFNTLAELPPATAMDYWMNRLWYTQGRIYIAGDIVGGSSGSLPYRFRDAILKVTENQLALANDGFAVPSQAGNIRALAHMAEMDTTLGQGLLYVFTRNAIYRLQVPVSRTNWIATTDNTVPIQTVVQLKYGTVGDRCLVRVNSDLFYQTVEPGIRSLQLAQRLFQVGQWGNVPISRNEQRILRFNDRELLRFASGIEWDNRLWQTALPRQTSSGVVFPAVIPLDFDLISTLEEKQPPAWEGMYEGLDHFQLFTGDFGGRTRAFSVARSAVNGSTQVWEMTDFLRTDMNLQGGVLSEARITWVVETAALIWGDVFLMKRLIGGELWVDRVYGEVVFTVEYRPDGDACWHFWHQWKICSARNSCEDVQNPICYPITPFAEGYREVMGLPVPMDECQPTMGRPVNVGYQFQARITVKGWCRIRGFVMYAEKVMKGQYEPLICPGLSPEAPLGPAQPGVSPGTSTAQLVIPNVPSIFQQVVPSSMPNVPVAGAILVGAPLDPILNPGVDPAVIVGHLEYVFEMHIEVDVLGNTVLSWNNILGIDSIGFFPINDLQIDRSTDNIDYFGFIHWVTTGPGQDPTDAH
jgi:hypothetical protein